MLQSGAEKVVIESKTILKAEDMGRDMVIMVIEEVLVLVLTFDNRLETMSCELFLGTNSTFEFSGSRPATTLPAVPPSTTMNSNPSIFSVSMKPVLAVLHGAVCCFQSC